MNIRELANELGLSKSTVSRALNGYLDVNPQTRLRVQEMALARGYTPDALARRLVRGKADAVGIVYSAEVDNLGNPQFLDMASGLSERLRQEHMDLLLVVAKDEAETSIYDRLFLSARVDAVVVPNTKVNDDRLHYLRAKGYPFLAYGRSRDCEDYSWFDFDNVAAGRMAVQHLSALGHTRIAYVHAPLEFNFALGRYTGFFEALDSVGGVCPAEYQVAGVLGRRGGLEAVAQLLALSTPPTAVVVDNNLAGVGVIRGLLDAGVKVGQEVSVVVHGDIPEDTLLKGMLVTTVSQTTPYHSGHTMAEMVIRVLAQTQPTPIQLVRSTQLIVGTTTGPVVPSAAKSRLKR